MDLSSTENLFHSLGKFAQEKMGFKKPPSLNLVSDRGNSEKPLGKTAYYDPQSMAITIYTDNRHTKDILRSLAHELVHHTQNEKGMLNDSGYHGIGYAQKNKNLRQSEKEAYLKGNMCFRDWEDGLKQQKPTIYNEWRNNDMSNKEWKNNELMENLSEKFGFKMDLAQLNESSCGGERKDEQKKSEEDLKEEKLEMTTVDGKKVPKFAADGEGENDLMKGKKDSKEEPEEESDKEEGDKEKSDDKEEQDSDKDLSKVPPQLRKHVAKSMKESRIMKIIKNEIRRQLKETK